MSLIFIVTVNDRHIRTVSKPFGAKLIPISLEYYLDLGWIYE